MENAKALRKKLTQITEKFVDVATQFENKLATEQQLKKQASKSIAQLTILKEVDSIDTQKYIDGFINVIKQEEEGINQAINDVCSDLYRFINSIVLD